jgi:hypothetical protein
MIESGPQAERRLHRQASELFRQAMEADSSTFVDACRFVHDTDAWVMTLRMVRRMESLPAAFDRAWFVHVLAEIGGDIRSRTNNDLLLLDAFRFLLPPYSGPDVTLFRGDSAENRRTTTYGFSWSSRAEVAKSWALGRWLEVHRHSVLVEAEVPSKAIICAPFLHSDAYDESEYIVDRRGLGKVRLIGRYSRPLTDREREAEERWKRTRAHMR